MFTEEASPSAALLFNFFLYFLKISYMYAMKYDHISIHKLSPRPQNAPADFMLLFWFSTLTLVSYIPTHAWIWGYPLGHGNSTVPHSPNRMSLPPLANTHCQ